MLLNYPCQVQSFLPLLEVLTRWGEGKGVGRGGNSGGLGCSKSQGYKVVVTSIDYKAHRTPEEYLEVRNQEASDQHKAGKWYVHK